MAFAAFWGTTVGYTAYNDSVILETSDGRVAVVTKPTFDYLYYQLNEFHAALKEDCIQYVIYKPDAYPFEYPQWFSDAIANGDIFYGDTRYELILYDESGDIAVAPNSMILRNYKGELKHLERYKFFQYYDTLEE